MNWRGKYQGGGYTIVAKRWWSPADRKAARLAAKLMEFRARWAE